MALNSPLRSSLGIMTRSALGVLETNGANPWNFAVDDRTHLNGQRYTNIGQLTPLTVIPFEIPGGVPHFPSSNNQLNGVVNKVMMTESGWYDFGALTSATSNGTYTGTGLATVFLMATCVVGTTTYVLYGTGGGSGANFRLGTTTDGKAITPIVGSNPIPIPVGYANFSNAVSRLSFDGTTLALCASGTTTTGSTRAVWFLTTNFGTSWTYSTQVVAITSFTQAWISNGFQYMYTSANALRRSTDYFRTTITSLPTTNLTNTGAYFQISVPMADGVRVLLAADTSQARVIHVDNSAPDIVLMGAGNGYFPCIDSDRTTIYAYDSGLVSSTDFTTWTQLTTDAAFPGKFPTFKQSQAVN